MGLFDNATYLIFDKDGEIVENKQHEDCIFIDKNDNGTYGIKLGLQGVEIERYGLYPNNTQLLVTSGSSFFDGYHLRVKNGDIGGEDYMLISISGNNFRSAGIIYKKSLESIAFQFFYEFAKFFLPEREPRCCCKENYNKVLLPYVNKIMQSMVKYHKLEECYGDMEWTKDMVARKKDTGSEVKPKLDGFITNSVYTE